MFKYEKNKLKTYLGEKLYNQLKYSKAIVAGGTITSIFCNREINDIDVYFKNKEDCASFLIEIADSKWILAKTEKAFLFKHDKIDVQAIFFKYFENVKDIFNAFDFTVCMGAFDFETEEFILHDDFLKHNAQRILKFNHGTAFPIISALRVQKYVDKGYYISRTEFIKIMLIICNLKISTFEELKEQIGGMYGENYDEILKEEFKENFDIVSIVEKIGDLQNECHYFKKAENVDFDGNWRIYINKMLGIELTEEEKKLEAKEKELSDLDWFD